MFVPSTLGSPGALILLLLDSITAIIIITQNNAMYFMYFLLSFIIFFKGSIKIINIIPIYPTLFIEHASTANNISHKISFILIFDCSLSFKQYAINSAHKAVDMASGE